MTAGIALHAQVEIDRAVHLAKAEGYVVNIQGKPLQHAEVTLDQNGKPIYTTRTDDRGAFHFDHASGHYTFRVARTEYAPAEEDVILDFQIASSLARKKLYVIVGPGACADTCSSVFTSKHDFQKALKKHQNTN
ncbi:MAG TPA: carboxypeptidase-like regulatory domain-containing protein [Terracidiphilus sp.]